MQSLIVMNLCDLHRVFSELWLTLASPIYRINNHDSGNQALRYCNHYRYYCV